MEDFPHLYLVGLLKHKQRFSLLILIIYASESPVRDGFCSVYGCIWYRVRVADEQLSVIRRYSKKISVSVTNAMVFNQGLQMNCFMLSSVTDMKFLCRLRTHLFLMLNIR